MARIAYRPRPAPFDEIVRPAEVTHDDEFFLGLDLGRENDPSALVSLARRRLPEAESGARYGYTVRGLKRWPLRTTHPTIVAEVTAIVAKDLLRGCTLGIDYTGCGRPVYDMFRVARPTAKLVPVAITGGLKASRSSDGWYVPKAVLVATVQVLLQMRRLSIPERIPEAKVLGKELLAFRAKISTSGHESFEVDWRQRAHDDLVLGLAIAAFLGERGGRRLAVCT